MSNAFIVANLDLLRQIGLLLSAVAGHPRFTMVLVKSVMCRMSGFDHQSARAIFRPKQCKTWGASTCAFLEHESGVTARNSLSAVMFGLWCSKRENKRALLVLA